MKRIVLGIAMLAVGVLGARAEVAHRVGVGAHYWWKIGDIDSKRVEKNNLAWIATYQLRPASLLKFEFDVELLPEKFQGAAKEVLAPQAYVVLGSGLYAAAGVGVYYDTEDGFADNPFFALRAGIDFALLPFLFADVNVNYRFEKWDELDGEDINADTLTLGAAVRLEL